MARISASTLFSHEIETKFVQDKSDSYLTTILAYCDEKEIDIIDVPKLLSKVLRDKLMREGVQLGHLKATSKPVHTF